LLVFPEAVVNELPELGDRLFRLGPVRLDGKLRALRAAEQKHAHHALRVRRLPSAADHDVARKLRRELDQLRRRTRMQPELVPDLEGATSTGHAVSPPSCGAAPAWSGSAPGPLILMRSTSRCTTSIAIPRLDSRRRASSSATVTERWRPPVHPTPTVR